MLTSCCSTGGIIALGLGAKNWSVEYCIQTFEDLCARAFTARIGSGIPGVGWLIENYNHSKYETQPLQEALMEAYSETEYLFGGVRSKDLFGSNTKVAVTSTSTAGCAVVLANYNRICRSKCMSMSVIISFGSYTKLKQCRINSSGQRNLVQN